MSDACPLQRNVFRVTHLNRALGNDNFCSKVDPLLAPKFSNDSSDHYINEIMAFVVYGFMIKST